MNKIITMTINSIVRILYKNRHDNKWNFDLKRVKQGWAKLTEQSKVVVKKRRKKEEKMKEKKTSRGDKNAKNDDSV